MPSNLLYLSTAALLPLALAQNRFINPVAKDADTTGFPQWNYGSTHNITWSANYSTISLVLWQDYGDSQGNSYYDLLLDKVPYQNSLSYNVNTTIDLNPNNVFYLRLYSGNFSSDSYIESHMFEIVKAANTSTVYSTVTATPTEALATITEQVAQTTGDPPKTAAATSGNPIASTSAADYGGLASVGRAVMGLTLGTGMGLILL